ncbi:MAG: sn-glycerol-3-phosphate ABC transporter ATP-binding protein UgpC [Alphaproteobacteria bacterium]|nr:sn-glycerol-3-phosphate ABC transporter ATP-binding protein UgpC [Alphaproteobacteria bacterium]
MAGLRLEKIDKSFGDVRVIKEIDLEIAHGEFVVFVGPSGCGKSTLLRMIAGLEDISAGNLYIGSELCNLTAPKDRGIAMVFQSYALYPHMTVYDNIGFGLKLARVPKAERDQKIRSTAKILQMENLLDRKPNQLSGGQRQRVAIGRAIVREPEVFLFDEPLSNLDAALRVDTRMEIAKLHHDLGATMIYVTHDQVEAMTLADKIVVLKDGTVQQIGSPLELYHHPKNLFVAGFIGSPKMNFFKVTIESINADSLLVQSADLGALTCPIVSQDVKIGDQLTLGLRPQHINIDIDQQDGVTAIVELVEHLGDETVLSLKLPSGQSIIATQPDDIDIEIGKKIGLNVQQAKAQLFNTEGLALASTNTLKKILKK